MVTVFRRTQDVTVDEHRIITGIDGRRFEMVASSIKSLQACVTSFSGYMNFAINLSIAGVENPKMIVDVGANMGMYSVMFSLAWPEAKIFAVEPVSQNLTYLRQNTEAFPNIEVVHAAASNKSGTVTMQMPTQEQLYKHRNVDQRTDFDIMSVHGESGRHKQEVRAITLDELVGEGPVDFMKIDAEGHDFHVLVGSQKLLRKQRPSVMVEVVDYTLEMGGFSPQDVNRLMAYYQYARMFRLHINEIFVPV